MFKKITLAVVALSVVALAESPVKVTVEFDKDVAVEMLKDWGSKIKDKAIEVAPIVKEKAIEGFDKAKAKTEELIEEAKEEREENITVEKKGIRI